LNTVFKKRCKRRNFYRVRISKIMKGNVQNYEYT
jgi:hypothetical protein